MAKRSKIKWTGLSKAQAAKATRQLNKELKAGKSPQYARRVARAMAKGKTKQAARGHKPKEHIERIAKERKRHGGLSQSDLKQVRSFLREFRKGAGNEKKGGPTEAALVEYIQDNGIKAFHWYRAKWRGLRAEYKAAQKSHSLTKTGTLGYTVKDFPIRSSESGGGAGGGGGGGGGDDEGDYEPSYDDGSDYGDEDIDYDHDEDFYEDEFDVPDADWLFYH